MCASPLANLPRPFNVWLVALPRYRMVVERAIYDGVAAKEAVLTMQSPT